MKGKKLDYAQAAALLGTKKSTLQSRVSRGEVPAYRLGPRHVVFDEEELLSFLQARRIGPPLPASQDTMPVPDKAVTP